jgi:hypothetical protein
LCPAQSGLAEARGRGNVETGRTLLIERISTFAAAERGGVQRRKRRVVKSVVMRGNMVVVLDGSAIGVAALEEYLDCRTCQVSHLLYARSRTTNLLNRYSVRAYR